MKFDLFKQANFFLKSHIIKVYFLGGSVCVYIYVCVCVCVCVYIYIERERERR